MSWLRNIRQWKVLNDEEIRKKWKMLSQTSISGYALEEEEQITGTPLQKETLRVIIVDVKDITAGIADSSLVYPHRRTGVARSRK